MFIPSIFNHKFQILKTFTALYTKTITQCNPQSKIEKWNMIRRNTGLKGLELILKSKIVQKIVSGKVLGFEQEKSSHRDKVISHKSKIFSSFPLLCCAWNFVDFFCIMQ